jgi:hypothetical protein
MEMKRKIDSLGLMGPSGSWLVPRLLRAGRKADGGHFLDVQVKVGSSHSVDEVETLLPAEGVGLLGGIERVDQAAGDPVGGADWAVYGWVSPHASTRSSEGRG